MSYAVKEIYYTLQGEGIHTGRPAVFLRFTGCNLWTGLEQDRQEGPGGCSRWCDTDFVGTDGKNGGKFTNAAVLVEAVKRLWPRSTAPDNRGFVVCTGGEPLLQLDTELLNAFEANQFEVAAETNGTQSVPFGPLWLTVSPKANAPLRLTKGNELKLVYPQEGLDPAQFVDMEFEHFFLQPLDDPNRAANTQRALDYCLNHPKWRLSLQTHKFIGIP